MLLIQQSDTAHPINILMTSSTDHVTGITGATVTVTLSKNGGTYGAAAGAVAEVGNGVYKLTPTSADTNTLGELAIHATATGADPADLLRQVVAFNPYDLAALGLSRLDVAVSTRNSVVPDNATISAIAGYVDTEITDIRNRLPAALVGGRMDANVGVNSDKTGYSLNLAQALSAPAATDGTQAHTLGEALNAARAQGFGKWTVVGTQLRLYAPDGVTIWRSFVLDSATVPTSRT